MSARRNEAASGLMTLWGWIICAAVSWLTIQTVDLAFQVLR